MQGKFYTRRVSKARSWHGEVNSIKEEKERGHEQNQEEEHDEEKDDVFDGKNTSSLSWSCSSS